MPAERRLLLSPSPKPSGPRNSTVTRSARLIRQCRPPQFQMAIRRYAKSQHAADSRMRAEALVTPPRQRENLNLNQLDADHPFGSFACLPLNSETQFESNCTVILRVLLRKFKLQPTRSHDRHNVVIAQNFGRGLRSAGANRGRGANRLVARGGRRVATSRRGF